MLTNRRLQNRFRGRSLLGGVPKPKDEVSRRYSKGVDMLLPMARVSKRPNGVTIPATFLS